MTEEQFYTLLALIDAMIDDKIDDDAHSAAVRRDVVREAKALFVTKEEISDD